MDWIFENLGKVISFIIFIFYILSSLKGKGEEEIEQDPQAQERARKIQEEIRRKILERQRGAAPATAEPPPQEQFYEKEPEVIFEENPASSYREEAEPPPIPVSTWNDEPAGDPFAEQKRLIEEQREKARVLRESLKQQKRHESYETDHRPHVSVDQIRESVRHGLSDSKSLKSAFVLKEVLDTPLGLR